MAHTMPAPMAMFGAVSMPSMSAAVYEQAAGWRLLASVVDARTVTMMHCRPWGEDFDERKLYGCRSAAHTSAQSIAPSPGRRKLRCWYGRQVAASVVT